MPGCEWPGRTLEYVTRRKAKAAYRAAQRARIMRPAWWSPENVAAKIANGMSRLNIARDGEVDCGKRTSATTLVRDIYRWEKSDEWGPLFQAAADVTVTPQDDSWWDDFFRAMDDTDGNIRLSAQIAGVLPRLVWMMTEPRFEKCYNEAFAERYAGALTAAQAKIASVMVSNLQKKGARAADQLAYLKATSPHHFQDRLKVSGTVKHQHELTPQAQIAAASRAKQLRPAPIEESVVEAEYVEVEG